ncbi:hypothetical protein D3C86_2238700 [compost metagenome]
MVARARIHVTDLDKIVRVRLFLLLDRFGKLNYAEGFPFPKKVFSTIDDFR